MVKKTRKFGGKNFVLYKSFLSEETARNTAARLRVKGWAVRVIYGVKVRIYRRRAWA